MGHFMSVNGSSSVGRISISTEPLNTGPGGGSAGLHSDINVADWWSRTELWRTTAGKLCVCVTVCVCVWLHAYMCVWLHVCVCVSPSALSCELCPCPCLLAARSHPAAGLWLGRGVGFLTQHGADCSGTCFNRWSRLESVITSERGLEERGCLPGAVWSPLLFNPKIPRPRHKPLYERRETRRRNRRGKHREDPSLSLSQHSALLPFRYLTFSQCFHFFF